MKIIGVLSWFNESPSWLAATVASFARVCDRLVCVDGRYALFDHDMSWSPIAETQAIVETAEGAGLPLTLHVPREPFYGNEVEKRNLLLRLAMIHAEPLKDWILVLDGDEYIVHHDVDFREQLAATEEYAASYALEEYMDPDNPDMPLTVARGQALANVWRAELRSIYRALYDLQYVGTHHSIGGYTSPLRRREDWVWLWGHKDVCQDRKMIHELVVRHRNQLRPLMRKRQASAYYAERDALQIEVMPKTP